MTVPIDIAYLAGGIALCLFGWILYLAGLKIVAGFLGGCFGGILGFFLIFLFGFPATPLRDVFFLFCVVIGILIGLFLFKKLHSILFFLVGASIGALIAYFLRPLAVQHQSIPRDDPAMVVVFHAMFVILFGIVSVFFSGYLLCLITPVIGIVFIALAWEITQFNTVMSLVWLSAFLFQLFTFKLYRRRKAT